MAVWDPQFVEQLKQNVTTPSAFIAAENARQRDDLLIEGGLQGERTQYGYDTYDRPELLSNQAARGAFATSATVNKDRRLGEGLTNSLADLNRQTESGLNKLTLRDLGASVPGLNLGI